MSLVTFSHTKDKEKEYYNELLEEKQWFDSEKFSVFIPANIDDFNRDLAENRKGLEQNIVGLQKAWEEIEGKYYQTVEAFNDKKLLEQYICHISIFGPEGKYKRPNLLFVRLRTKHDEETALETIGHEFLHLIFADLFESKGLDYSGREGMVDALILESKLSDLFPNYRKQSIGKVRHRLLKSILA